MNFRIYLLIAIGYFLYNLEYPETEIKMSNDLYKVIVAIERSVDTIVYVRYQDTFIRIAESSTDVFYGNSLILPNSRPYERIKLVSHHFF